MEFRVGYKFKIKSEYLHLRQFADCSEDTIYTVCEACEEFTWLRFRDDVYDKTGVGATGIKRHIEWVITPPKDTPEFMGYETARDFEQIIDYALASNDLALFNECTAELHKRGLLEDYVSLV